MRGRFRRVGGGQTVSLPGRGAQQHVRELGGPGQHRPVTGGQFEEGHPGIDQFLQRGIALVHPHLDQLDARPVPGAQHAGEGQRRHRAGQPERLEQGSRRLGRGQGREPVQRRTGHALDAAPAAPLLGCGRGRERVTRRLVTARCGQPFAQHPVGHRGHGGNAVARHARVQVHDPADASGPAVGRAQRGMDAVVVADQDDLLGGGADGVDHRDDVRDVGLQVDAAAPRAAERGVQPGRTDGVRLGARGGQPGRRLPPDVRAGEHARHQDEKRS